MKIKKLVSILLLFSILPFFTSGCWDRRELEDEAFVITIGVDKGKQDQLLVTFRIAIPSKTGLGQAGGGGAGGKGSPAEQASLITTIEAPSITSAVVLASGYIDRELSLLHTKGIVFGEDFAREGVGRVLSLLTRYRELRRNVFVCVARGQAYEMLSHNKPDLEKSYAKWWEGVKMLDSSEGSHPGTLFHEFITDASKSEKQANMMYFAVNKNSKKEKPEDIKLPSSFQDGELKVKAGEIPRIKGNAVEHMGTAVFKKDKLVDVLDLSETRSRLMLTGDFKRTQDVIPDPAVKHSFISLEIKQGSHPDIKVNLKGETVQIREKVYLEGDLIGVQSDRDYGSDPQAINKLNKAVSRALEKRMMSFIKKEQSQGVDTIGFGSYAKRHFLTEKEWNEFKWPEKFRSADISVSVKFELRRTGMQGKQPGPYF